MLRSLATTAAILVVLGSGCTGAREVLAPVETPAPTLPTEPLPSAMREFRAAWIATVANIDWPSARGLPADSQRTELTRLLDQASKLGMNAVIFQVRPMADALYESSLEPWSIYLTGHSGVSPGYDPLAFVIEEAHRRGMELHAWFNPFRAGHPTHEGMFDSLHVSVREPSWVVRYGAQLWLDPGVEAARDHSREVMLDVVRRYDLDGVHMDDYFYPYAVQDSTGREIPFPDSASWGASGFVGSRADWRRQNVDDFVFDLYRAVKAERPEVKVGISPFGIWRPGHPEGITGFDQYEGLYADARKWLREGWVDYFTPQLYWAMDSAGQPYGPLLDWWVEQNIHERHIWPGNYASRVILEGNAHWEADELVRQVAHTRLTPGATGNVHFSMKALMPWAGADSLLLASVYADPAIPPPTTWLGGHTPGVPLVSLKDGILGLDPGDGQAPLLWHVRQWQSGQWTVRVIPGTTDSLVYNDVPDVIVITAVSRLGLEGPPAWFFAHSGHAE